MLEEPTPTSTFSSTSGSNSGASSSLAGDEAQQATNAISSTQQSASSNTNKPQIFTLKQKLANDSTSTADTHQPTNSPHPPLARRLTSSFLVIPPPGVLAAAANSGASSKGATVSNTTTSTTAANNTPTASTTTSAEASGAASAAPSNTIGGTLSFTPTAAARSSTLRKQSYKSNPTGSKSNLSVLKKSDGSDASADAANGNNDTPTSPKEGNSNTDKYRAMVESYKPLGFTGALELECARIQLGLDEQTRDNV